MIKEIKCALVEYVKDTKNGISWQVLIKLIQIKCDMSLILNFLSLNKNCGILEKRKLSENN